MGASAEFVKKLLVIVLVLVVGVGGFALGRATGSDRGVAAPPLATSEDLDHGGPTAVIVGTLVPQADCVALVNDEGMYLTVWPNDVHLTVGGVAMQRPGDYPPGAHDNGTRSFSFNQPQRFIGGIMTSNEAPAKYRKAMRRCLGPGPGRGVALIVDTAEPTV